MRSPIAATRYPVLPNTTWAARLNDEVRAGDLARRRAAWNAQDRLICAPRQRDWRRGSVCPRAGVRGRRRGGFEPRVTCVGLSVKALLAWGSGPQALVKVERPQRSEDVRP